MYFWIAIWVVIVIIIFGTFLWSISTLLRQKRAWKAVADKYKLTYVQGKFLESPLLEGTYNGFRAAVFSEPRETQDARGRRFTSVVQFALPSGMPVAGAIASASFADLVRIMQLPHNVKIVHEGWDYTIIAQAKEPDLLEGFLTPARLAAIDTLSKTKGCGVLFIFDRQETYLRLETSDPLDSPTKLDVLLKKLHAAAQALSTQTKEKPAETPAG